MLHNSSDQSFSAASSRPSKNIDNYERVRFQFWIGIVHFFTGILDSHVQSFQQAIVIREPAFRIGQFPELAMHRLNRVGGVNDPPNVLWIFEVGR